MKSWRRLPIGETVAAEPKIERYLLCNSRQVWTNQRSRTIVGVDLIDSDRSEWYFVWREHSGQIQLQRFPTVVRVYLSHLGPKQITQVHSERVVCPRRVHDERLVGVRRVCAISDLRLNDWQRAEFKPLCICWYRCQGAIEWPYGIVERASDWGSGMLDLNGCFHWLLESFAVFYGRKAEKQIWAFFWYCACVCM